MGARAVDLAPRLALELLDEVEQGIVVFDASGRVFYANRAARQGLRVIADLEAERAEVLIPRLSAWGGRRVAGLSMDAEAWEAVVFPAPPASATLADQERRAIVASLEASGWRLAETARRLGISRTTLWRRLRAYGLSARAASR